MLERKYRERRQMMGTNGSRTDAVRKRVITLTPPRWWQLT